MTILVSASEKPSAPMVGPMRALSSRMTNNATETLATLQAKLAECEKDAAMFRTEARVARCAGDREDARNYSFEAAQCDKLAQSLREAISLK